MRRILVEYGSGSRPGLVCADSGAEAMTSAGWARLLNHGNGTATFGAVVNGWECHFGVRALGVGLDALNLGVAVLPAGMEQPLQVWQPNTSRSVRTTSCKASGAACGTTPSPWPTDLAGTSGD